MKRLINYYGTRCLRALAILFLGTGLLCHGQVWGYESSGLTLSLHADPDHANLKFILGQDPIKLIMVISNDTHGPITTDRGFSQVELHHSLIVIDPGGKRHELRQENGAHKMSPPFFLNDQPWGLAETLPADWVRSVTIEDLTELIPMMKTTAGWFTIEAQQPFGRFARTGQDAGLGFLGLLDHSENWHGTVNSDKIQILIAPAEDGAQIKVQVMDSTVDPAEPLAQIPVRVFKNSDIQTEYDLKDAWAKAEPVLIGTTDLQGWAIWPSGASCMPKDEYTAIAYYKNEYKAGFFTPEDDGWAAGCTGLIEKQIVFGICYQPKMCKQQAIGFLLALLETADKNNKKRIDEAITLINKSLGGDLWEDDSHLTKKGKEVFDKEKKAVKELMKVKHLDVTNAINSILRADELLAQTAIYEAITSDQKEIDKANKEMDRGQKEIDKGKYDKAIDHYKKAWKHAQKAL